MTLWYDSRFLSLHDAINVATRIFNERLEGRTFYDWVPVKAISMPTNDAALQNAVRSGGKLITYVDDTPLVLQDNDVLEWLNLKLSFYHNTPYTFHKMDTILPSMNYQGRQDYLLVNKDVRVQIESWRAPVYEMLRKMLERDERCNTLSFVILNDQSLCITTWNCAQMDLRSIREYFFIISLQRPISYRSQESPHILPN